ncbi:MAG: hypothetical protein HY758_04385 [Nitrospirae bacterium]|nr:hypothetical protein [Nitrospirota bacterium]
MSRWRRAKSSQVTFAFIILAIFISFKLPSSLSAQGVEVFSNLGLYGGQVYDIEIDPSHPDKMFAASYMGDGLFITTSGGNTWQAVKATGALPGEDEFKDHAVYAVKTAPSDPDVVWAEHNYWAEKSTDGGQTWTHIKNSTMQRDCQDCGGTGDNFRLCRSLVVDPTDSQKIYIGTGGPNGTYSSGAIYKTTDGGTTWSKMKQGNNFDFTVIDIAVDPQNTNIIWAVTNSYGYGGWGGTLYRSGDGGNTWSSIFSLTPYKSAYLTVAVKPDNSNIVFTGSGVGIIKHYFNGTAWKYSWPIISGSSSVRNITFDPQSPNTLYAAWYKKVARSTDGGSAWTTYNHNYTFWSLAVHPADSEVIFAGEIIQGVFKSLDHGQTWSPVNNGINAVIVYDVVVDPNDSTHILAGTISGIYERKDTAAWSRLTTSSTRSLRFHPTNSQIFYAGRESYLAKTLDGGMNWTNSNVLGNGNNYVSDIALDSANTNTIYVTTNGYDNLGGVYKSSNEGAFFTKVLDGVNQASENYPFSAVAIDPSDSQNIFAGGGNYFTPYVAGDIWESKDGGANWNRTSLRNVIINALLINPDNPDIMYAGHG